MGKVVWKAGTLLAPVPAVMVTCGTLEKPNVLTIAWTGIVNTIPPMTYISVRPERHSYGIIKASGEFVINLTTVELCRAADFCGVKSGSDTDKFAARNLSVEPSSELSAPILAESPLSLECRVKQVLPLGSHDMFLAEIVAVNVDEKLIDKAGKLDLHRANLLAYAHGEYFKLGEKIGSFGFSVRKKPAPDGRKQAFKKRKKY
ncbi:MAG: flavin reductase family protein [Oscillospiraceae bacterium]